MAKVTIEDGDINFCVNCDEFPHGSQDLEVALADCFNAVARHGTMCRPWHVLSFLISSFAESHGESRISLNEAERKFAESLYDAAEELQNYWREHDKEQDANKNGATNVIPR